MAETPGKESLLVFGCCFRCGGVACLGKFLPVSVSAGLRPRLGSVCTQDLGNLPVCQCAEHL